MTFGPPNCTTYSLCIKEEHVNPAKPIQTFTSPSQRQITSDWVQLRSREEDNAGRDRFATENQALAGGIDFDARAGFSLSR